MAINQIYQSAQQTTPGGGTAIAVDVSLTLETRNLMEGILTEDDDTTPIAGAAVDLIEYTTNPSDGSVVARAYTRADGSWGIPFLPAGGKKYVVDIFGPNPVV